MVYRSEGVSIPLETVRDYLAPFRGERRKNDKLGSQKGAKKRQKA